MATHGKYALVTGSSRGIGRGIALALAEQGTRVAVHYHQNEAAAADTLARIRARGGEGIAVQADVSRPEEVRALFAQVRDAFGALDIFVANARPELATLYRP